jgi:RNA polymerase primary sigma factor
MRKIRHRLYQELGRQPTTVELALELDMTAGALEKLEASSLETVSLDTPIRGEDEGEATELKNLIEDLDAPQPEFIVSQRILRRQIRGVVAALPPRDRRIVQLRFGLTDGFPRTLSEVAKEFGISRERVRQVQERALGRIRSQEAASRLR